MKSYILFWQPGLDEAVPIRKEKLSRPVLATMEQQP